MFGFKQILPDKSRPFMKTSQLTHEPSTKSRTYMLWRFFVALGMTALNCFPVFAQNRQPLPASELQVVGCSGSGATLYASQISQKLYISTNEGTSFAPIG